MTTLTKTERAVLIDFCFVVCQACWEIDCISSPRFPRVFFSSDIQRRAHELFLIGFSDRLFRCPPTETGTESETLWNDYLGTMNDRIILCRAAYPDTPLSVLACAKDYYLAGFSAGRIVVREIVAAVNNR